MFCSKCGKEIHDEAVICVHCGCAVEKNSTNVNAGNRDWLVALLLSWFLGCIGVHRFYTGRIGSGVAQLLTLGGCGIWAFVDWVCICFNNFKDGDGQPLKNYKKDVGLAIFVVGIIFTIIAMIYGLSE